MDDARPAEPPTPRERFSGGMRIGLGLAFPTFLLAVTFGATARELGWGPWAPVVASVVVFSGSAQFTLLTVLGGGGSLPTAVTSAALINARFAPMGLAVAPNLRGGRLRRAAEGQTVVDGSFVAAHLGGGRFDRERMMGATAVQFVAWVGGTVVGVLLAPPEELTQALGLDVVFPGFFLLLLLDEIRHSRRAAAAAGFGGAIALGLTLAVPAGVALLGSAVAAFIGLRGGPPEDAADEEVAAA